MLLEYVTACIGCSTYSPITEGNYLKEGNNRSFKGAVSVSRWGY